MGSRSAHVLEPGEKLLRNGNWVDTSGNVHSTPCMDPDRAAADLAAGAKPAKKRSATKKKGA